MAEPASPADFPSTPGPRPGALCRDCLARLAPPPAPLPPRCPACGGARLLTHAELYSLSIAHLDCDAFYASVEKRDRPELRARPVIVGGNMRGVVSTACYLARLRGVASAMPIARARQLCPDAVILPPNFPRYREEAEILRGFMRALTPLVLPLSIDEAVLDLAGTEALHGAPPASLLAALARRIESERGLTVSIGLAPNRLLARIAAARDKPRGFSVMGADAPDLLRGEALSLLPGVGRVRAESLARRGFTQIGQIQGLSPGDARQLLGEDGPALVAAARGEDHRAVDPASSRAITLSAETTFATDLADPAALEHELWPLCEKLATRLRHEGMAAGGTVLKLKTADFRSRTRQTRLTPPTQLPDTLFDAARRLLAREADGTAFRLIGIGAAPLTSADSADTADLADPTAPVRAARQAAINALRDKFGDTAVQRGRGWTPKPRGGS